MDKVVFVQMLMKRGYKHPVALFYFPTGIVGENGISHKYDIYELVLDDNFLAGMFDEAMMGIVPDVLTSLLGVGLQYNPQYTYIIDYLGDK